jgi:heme exporter protein D
MPKNKFIYYGILIVAATALLWAGYQITNIALMILPWAGGIGALTIIVGLVMEAKKSRASEARKLKRENRLRQASL